MDAIMMLVLLGAVFSAALLAIYHWHALCEPRAPQRKPTHVVAVGNPHAGTFSGRSASSMVIKTTRLTHISSLDAILTVTPTGEIVPRYGKCNPDDYHGHLLMERDQYNIDCVDHLGNVLHSFNLTDIFEMAAHVSGVIPGTYGLTADHIDGTYACTVGWAGPSIIFNYRTGRVLCHFTHGNLNRTSSDHALRIGNYFAFGYNLDHAYILRLLNMKGECVLMQRFDNSGGSPKMFVARDKLVLFSQDHGSVISHEITLAP